MATTNAFNGDSLYVEVDGSTVAFAQSHTLSVSVDLPDATNKDSSRWEEHIRGNRSWTVTAEGLTDFATSFGVNGMFDEINTGDGVTLEFTTNVSGDSNWTGTANVESMDIDSPQGAPVTYSVTFKGTGALTRNTV